MVGQRRNIQGFNQPVDPFAGGKAGGKDPRGFVSGNVPGQAWDIEQFAADRVSLRDFPPQQYSQAHSNTQSLPDAVVRTIPTRVNYVPWSGRQPGFVAFTPFILVPKNNKRMDIVVAHTGDAGTMIYSWGPPLIDPTGKPIGFSITPNLSGNPQRSGNVVPINELWVWGDTGQMNFLAYEGTNAPEANLVP